ncbi:MAG: WxcM-like domain-containing protein [Bacteroidia bacterium]|nr:WxcM-like domain-containing protein [Bacteroidia bacterium]MCF8445911.1 WxcM-like domain-containing protein [Bacteroidia bacterium]
MGVIEGNIHRDERGVVRFVNDFDMSRVVRMYCIEPKLGVVRAWHGHKKETKWFYAAKGSFVVKVIDMNTRLLNQYVLTELESMVLEIPGGNYNGFEALEEGSVLMVFSNFSLEKSKADDFRLSIQEMAW